jgi:hypothetical protein
MSDLQTTTEKQQPSLPNLLEARIINAATPEEAREWSKVREELIKQNTELENQQHRRFLEKGLFWSKQVFSYAAIVGGTILAMKGFDTLGYFIIGGGLYQVAPGYLRAIINKYKTEENDDDSGEK